MRNARVKRELEERRFKQLLRDCDDWDLATRHRAFADATEAAGQGDGARLGRVFLKPGFFERRDGNCRLLPSLTHALSATAPEWAERLAPYAEEVASMLRTSEPPRDAVTEDDTPLTAWVPRLVRSPLTGQNRGRRPVPANNRDACARPCSDATGESVPFVWRRYGRAGTNLL